MHSLHEAGLRGAHLFEVDTPLMVSRYNDCLGHLGLEPTKLEEFSIDKVGWSPEIAEEKKDDLYLSHGDANLFGIILSMAQADAALHYPNRSFDRAMLDRVFEEEGRALRDLTTLTGVCLDFEDGISCFESLEDLLMINSFTVEFSTPGGWSEAAKWQKEMVSQFESSDSDWEDDSVHVEISEHVKMFGDLRRRNLIVHPVRFKDVSCFFSRSFGGVFVLRDECSGKDMVKNTLIVSLGEQEGVDSKTVYAVDDAKLLDVLEKREFLRHSAEEDLHRMDQLKGQRSDVEAIVLSAKYPDITFADLSSGQRKGLVNEHRDLFPKEYFELERYLHKLSAGGSPKLSKVLRKKLLLPVSCDSRVREETLMMLLSLLDPTNLVRLYRFNKMEFYERYKDWPKSLREWAIFRIMRDYKNVA